MDEFRDKNMVSIRFNDKIGFVIAFFTAIIALYPFKDKIDAYDIDILIGSFSLSSLVMVFLGLLFLSIYLYALNYIRYDFPRLLTVRYLKYVEYLAHLFYFVAVLVYPLFLLVMWGVSSLLELLSLKLYLLKDIFFMVASVVFVLFSLIIQVKRFIERELELSEAMVEEERQFVLKTKEIYQEKIYGMTLMTVYAGLMKVIKLRLLKDFGLDVNRVDSRRLINLIDKHKLLSSEDITFLHDLRMIRNRMAHGELAKSITKEKAKAFIDRGNKIVRKLRYV